jgi:S-formylglutathione hydrolase
MKWMLETFNAFIPGAGTAQQPDEARGSASFAGHAKQEANELVTELKLSTSRLAVVERASASATGFAFKKLTADANLSLSPGKADSSKGPADDLVLALAGLDRRVVMLPEVHSGAAGRNVRFAVVLPPKFDPTRPGGYPVVGVLPDLPPGNAIPALLADGFVEKTEGALKGKGLGEAIVVVPERFEDKVGAVPNAELDKFARAVLIEDLVPWTRKHLNGRAGEPTLVRTDMSAVAGLTAKGYDAVGQHGGAAAASGPGLVVSAEGDKAEKKPFVDLTPRLLKGLRDIKEAVVVREKGDAAVATLNEVEKVLTRGGTAVDLPDARDLERLKERKSPTVIVAKLELGDEKVPVTFVVPPGYDPARAKGYAPALVAPSPELSAGEVAKKVRAAAQSIPDTILIVPDLTKKQVEAAGGDSVAAARALFEAGALSGLESLNLDFSRYLTTKLKDDGKVDLSSIESVALPGTMMNMRGEWRMLAPRNSYKQSYPSEPSFVTKTEVIPTELQRQPETHGTFFAPVIDSKAVKSPMRVGVYLPPGYDPASKETYPVLVMLPGKGNTLNVWTSEGRLAPKLDKLMAGDAQKMIVVIPGNTDSFWFDYDKNGKGSFGTPGKRDFEGLVMDELIGYATKTLKGDPKRMSIGGISRGGFGAMQLALRHPDKFKSVSAHSAPLALLHHEGVIGNMGAKAMVEHLGEPGTPAWRRFNPADLLEDGALEKHKAAPQMLVDVGAEEPYFLEENLAFARAAAAKGAPLTLRVLSKEGAELKHNWELWAQMLETWVSFHQSAHGKAGKPKVPGGVKDVAAELGPKHAAELEARREQVQAELAAAGKDALATRQAARDLIAAAADFQPFEPGAMARQQLTRVIDAAPQLADRAKAIATTPRVLHVQEHLAGVVTREVQELASEVGEALRRMNGGVGTRPALPVAAPGAIGKLPEATRAAVEAVFAAVPETRAALELLATVRPELLTRHDPKSGGAFAEQLRAFVEDGKLAKDEGPGLAEFIRRMAVRRFDWRRGGFSRSTCSAMLSVFNHPGLILNLVRAARDGNDYGVQGVYSGDGARKLPPKDDWKAGFHPVGATHDLPGAALGYERGWLRAVVQDLPASAHSLPKERFAALCDADAVGLSKLVGEQVHYRYAFNLRTGDDLVKALATQGEEGLAMADVKIRLGKDEPWHGLHFPVFYDYDAKSGTVAFQHWEQGERRIPVKDLEFFVDGKDGPAIFMRGPESALHDILTPWKQKNWLAIKDDWKGPLPEPAQASAPARDKPEATGGPAPPQSFGNRWRMNDRPFIPASAAPEPGAPEPGVWRARVSPEEPAPLRRYRADGDKS